MSDLNLLLVDDDQEFLASLVESLIDSGLNVLSASDGQEALEIMKQMKIDIAVVDVVMPGLGGIETLSEIKKAHPELEVIMLTGLADIKTTIDAMKQGAFDYLIKPVQLDELLTRILEAYKRRTLKQNLALHQNGAA